MKTTHIANPVKVSAEPILGVSIAENGVVFVHFSDGSEHVLEPAMTARYMPSAGDYIVTQEDGYVYVNPKDVFERKYSLITE